MTVLEVLNAAAGFLEKQGIESSRLNAEYLLAHVLGKKKRIDLYLEFDRPLGEQERAPLRELVRRRADGTPLQHLLGTVDFCGRIFKSDSRALIPRPETEQLVELIASHLTTPPRRILDVGTGSGVIAISLAGIFPEAEVVAIDLSSDALALARENAVDLAMADRVVFQSGDLLSGLDGRFDLIAANLPYIPTAEISLLSKEVQNDPVTALDGGPDGLTLIRRLADEAQGTLEAGGFLALEIGFGQSPTLVDILSDKNYRDIKVHADYQNVPRFIVARYG